MSQPNISYVSHIATYAKTRSSDLSVDEAVALDATLRAVQFVDGSGQISFNLGNGRTGNLDAALSLYGEGMGKPASTATTPARTGDLDLPASATATDRAAAMNAAIRAGKDTVKQSRAETLVATYGNPWRTGNATHRAYITNVHPTLASRLRREAGERA